MNLVHRHKRHGCVLDCEKLFGQSRLVKGDLGEVPVAKDANKFVIGLDTREPEWGDRILLHEVIKRRLARRLRGFGAVFGGLLRLWI